MLELNDPVVIVCIVLLIIYIMLMCISEVMKGREFRALQKRRKDENERIKNIRSDFRGGYFKPTEEDFNPPPYVNWKDD